MIKSEILITLGIGWPVSSDKWKAPRACVSTVGFVFFIYKMLGKVDSAGMATLLPRTGFLHTKGAFVFYQDDDLNCFYQNCQMLAFKAMFL